MDEVLIYVLSAVLAGYIVVIYVFARKLINEVSKYKEINRQLDILKKKNI